MKNRKWGLLTLGLAVFIAVVSFPLWYNARRSVPTPVLSLDTPVIQSMAEKKCVEPKMSMRANHMKILNAWRDEVVREAKREYTATDGRRYEKSLTRTCLACHSNKKQFCDRCHSYVSAKPACFDCHISPEEVNP
jgi:cytochrome c1